MHCGIVPPYILEHLASHGDEAQRLAAQETLRLTAVHRQRRLAATSKPATKAEVEHRNVFNCHNASTMASGTLSRSDSATPATDPAVNEAYEGLGATHDLYWFVFERDSIDNEGLALNAYVHYGNGYDNAFWDGSEMIFGDGDGVTFNRFTVAVDVIGHELTHGVVQHERNLTYQDQSGALNESLADVFGSMVKQRVLGQTVEEADWLIDKGLLKESNEALRSLKAPGTAYDDPALGGRDPQPNHMDHYTPTDDDNGGVHLYSGIPNHAFYLAAMGIGGKAWEGAGLVWYDAMRSKSLQLSATFADFAKIAVTEAQARYGMKSSQAGVVRDAWQSVGVLKRSA